MLFVCVDVLTGKDQSSLIVIGLIALFIGYLPGGLIGTFLRLFRGDGGDGVSPVQRSLADYALAARTRSTPRHPPARGSQPSEFAERLLTGSRAMTLDGARLEVERDHQAIWWVRRGARREL